MGEPAIPTDEERAFNRAFAKSVVDAVRNEEDQPQPRYPDGDAMSDDLMIFRLAQEIELLREELEESNRAADVLYDVGRREG